jgi:hypothetical protein
MKVGDKYPSSQLGECTVYAIESAHTIIVVNKAGQYFRVSGLSPY